MQLDLLLLFITEQWLLVLALAATLSVLFYYEASKSGPSVSCQQAINWVNSEDGVFLDIRDVGDFKKGHVVDALHIPFAKLGSRIDELNNYRDKPVIIVCKLGQTAGGAAKLLREKGFTRAHKMGGGMTEWQAQKLPVVSA
ncbi:MAG: rhodanese-like domain-containing protein [Haliea sp.]|nr:rhodanese-like domain-containing protein [Haliea sp.]